MGLVTDPQSYVLSIATARLFSMNMIPLGARVPRSGTIPALTTTHDEICEELEKMMHIGGQLFR